MVFPVKVCEIFLLKHYVATVIIETIKMKEKLKMEINFS